MTGQSLSFDTRFFPQIGLEIVKRFHFYCCLAEVTQLKCHQPKTVEWQKQIQERQFFSHRDHLYGD